MQDPNSNHIIFCCFFKFSIDCRLFSRPRPCCQPSSHKTVGMCLAGTQIKRNVASETRWGGRKAEKAVLWPDRHKLKSDALAARCNYGCVKCQEMSVAYLKRWKRARLIHFNKAPLQYTHITGTHLGLFPGKGYPWSKQLHYRRGGCCRAIDLGVIMIPI